MPTISTKQRLYGALRKLRRLAVLAAEDFAANEDFIVINSDNHYPLQALTQLQLIKVKLVMFEQERLHRVLIQYLDGNTKLINHEDWSYLKLNKHCFLFQPTFHPLKYIFEVL